MLRRLLSQGKVMVFASALAAVVVAIAVVSVFRARTTAEKAAATVELRNDPRPCIAPRRTSTQPVAAQPRPKPVLSVSAEEAEDDDGRTPEEKSLAERIEKALDEEDFEMAVSCIDEAQKCGVAEIRQSMVDTLGWFGERALPELTPFLADADEDVRESAMNEWTLAMSSIEDEVVRLKTVELAMGVLKNEDALEDISGEYIGVDEKLAVESLVRVIEGGGTKEGVEKAKEAYEFVTGDEWTGAEGAERWIAEEYEPSEGP